MAAYKDKRDGRWRYRKWIRRLDGKRIRITGTPAVDTKVAAEAAERAHIDRELHPERVIALAAAVVPKRKEMPTFKEYAVKFMAGYLPGQKPSERHSKNQILDGHLIPFFGPMALDEIQQEDVDAFGTQELQRCKRKTVNNRLTVLSTLLGYAHANKLIPESTLRCHVGGGVKTRDTQAIAVPELDVAELVRAATDDRYKVAVLLAAEGGLRIGEIRGAQWTDIANGEITIRRAIDTLGNVGAPKHDKIRTVPLSVGILSAIAKLTKAGLWLLCDREGGALGYRATLNVVRKIYKRAGVDVPVSETGHTAPWHGLRHTFGTVMVTARGISLPIVQELMGHENVETTMRYVQVSNDDKRNAISQAFGSAGCSRAREA